MQRIGSQGGMSQSNAFDVEFDFGSGRSLPFSSSFYTEGDNNLIRMLCDEGQLPNVQSATAQITGRYQGEGPVSYPHTRIYTDLSLGFLLDANAIPLKFFSSWYDFIFGEAIETKRIYDGTIEQAETVEPRAEQRVTRLRYMDDYTCTLRIMKTEPNQKASNGRAPITYILENCYPYSIDAVPLAYGSTQITRATVNFYYTRHTVAYGNNTYSSSRRAIDSSNPGRIVIGRDDPFAPVTPQNP